MSFHKYQGFINPDAHAKLLRFEMWRSIKMLPTYMGQLYLGLVGLGAILLELWALSVLGLDKGCCFGAVGSILGQSLYMYAVTHDLTLQMVVGLVPAPHRVGKSNTEAPGPKPPRSTDTPGIEGPDDRVGQLNTFVWNSTVFSVRVVGMLGAVIGALAATAFHKYNMPFLEPFLVISSAQAFFFTITRLLSDVGDSLFDVSMFFTTFAKRLYRLFLLASLILTAFIFRNPFLCALLTFSMGTIIHCGLECTANYSSSYTSLVYNDNGQGKSTSKATAVTFSPPLKFYLLSFLMPWIPCMVLLGIVSLGEGVARYYILLALGIVLAGNLLLHLRLLPVRGAQLLKFTFLLLSGHALFYNEFSAKLSASARRETLSTPPPSPSQEGSPATKHGSPSRRAGLSKRNREIKFNRPAAIAVVSVGVWVFVFFSQVSMLELTQQHSITDTYDLIDTPDGGLVFKFHFNNDSVFDIRFTPTSNQSSFQRDAGEPIPVLCQLDIHSVKVVEYSLFAATTYLPERLMAPFVERLAGPEWQLRKVTRSDSNQVSFLDFYNAARNVSVIAIRVS